MQNVEYLCSGDKDWSPGIIPPDPVVYTSRTCGEEGSMVSTVCEAATTLVHHKRRDDMTMWRLTRTGKTPPLSSRLGNGH